MSELLSAKVMEYELVVAGLTAEQYGQLAKGAARHIYSDGQTLLGFAEDAGAQQAIRRTIEWGGRVLSLTPRTETLEQYFIRQVKGEAA